MAVLCVIVYEEIVEGHLACARIGEPPPISFSLAPHPLTLLYMPGLDRYTSMPGLRASDTGHKALCPVSAAFGITLEKGILDAWIYSWPLGQISNARRYQVLLYLNCVPPA